MKHSNTIEAKSYGVDTIKFPNISLEAEYLFIPFLLAVIIGILLRSNIKLRNKQRTQALEQEKKRLDLTSQLTKLNPSMEVSFDSQGEVVLLNSKANLLLATIKNSNTSLPQGPPFNALFPELSLKKIIAENQIVKKTKQIDKQIYHLKVCGLREFDTVQVYGSDVSEEFKVKNELKQLNESFEEKVTQRVNSLKEQMYLEHTIEDYNRLKLEKALQDEKGLLGLILVNIDNFSSINAAYGYRWGNEVIRQFSDFLNKAKTADSVLYRISGDEFAILVKGKRIKTLSIIKKIKQILAGNPIAVKEEHIHLTCSLGVSFGENVPHLDRAMMAIMVAKQRGGGLVIFFNEKIDQEIKNKNDIIWAQKIKRALAENRVIPFFQGIHNNQTGLIDKFEVLARMEENGQIIIPDIFLGPAKKAGLLREITQTMVKKSFAYFKGKECEFSINITSKDLEWGYLGRFLLNQANANFIKPEQVTLELLEDINILDQNLGQKRFIEKIKNLKGLGFKIAIDDFGTENSNFAKVLDLDVNYIKIDAKFIRDIDKNNLSKKLTKSISELTEQLGAKTIAEFVHSKSVQKEIELCDVDYSQGYYYGEPTPDPFAEINDKIK